MEIASRDLGPIDYGNPKEGRLWTRNPEMMLLGLRILALCAWPSDPGRRSQFQASYLGCMMGALQQSPPILDLSDIPPRLRERVAKAGVAKLEPAFKSIGGLLSATLAPSPEAFGGMFRKKHGSIGDRWLSVGAQLQIARSIAIHHPDIGRHGASLNKARFVLNDCTKWCPTTLLSNWTAFYPVAHFCAAVYALSTSPGLTEQFVDGVPALPIFLDTLPILLGLAADFEEWGTSYVPHGVRLPLLCPQEIYSAKSVNCTWTVNWRCPPLSGPYLEALGNYKAQQRAK